MALADNGPIRIRMESASVENSCLNSNLQKAWTSKEQKCARIRQDLGRS